MKRFTRFICRNYATFVTKRYMYDILQSFNHGIVLLVVKSDQQKLKNINYKRIKHRGDLFR
ncbi:hypothetical protein WVIC16_130236 [Weissella viridescens]|nr:hypothetical protein WVIC16_130236 [Weissella viridescens]